MNRTIVILAIITLLLGCSSQKESDVVGIANKADLIAFAEAVNSGATLDKWTDEEGIINLFEDIDMSGTKNWVAIGNCEITAFNGIFHGNGHKIENLNISSDSSHVGLFGINLGIIKGVVVDKKSSIINRSTSANSYTAAIVAENKGVIDSCYNYASITAHGGSVGGIAGRSIYSRNIYQQNHISNSNNHGTITGQSNDASVVVGGIVGWSYQTPITNCINSGNVTNNGALTGGVVGLNGSHVTKSTNQATVKGFSYAGGIVGHNSDVDGIIEECINNGDISAQDAVGGICGVNKQSGVIENNINNGTPDVEIGLDYNKLEES